MAFITKEDAQAIADKLGAQIVAKTAHDVAKIYYEGQLVAWYGIKMHMLARFASKHHVHKCLGLCAGRLKRGNELLLLSYPFDESRISINELTASGEALNAGPIEIGKIEFHVLESDEY